MKRTLLVMMFVGTVTHAAEKDSDPKVKLGARLDCLTDFNKDKGSSQDCFSLSGLRATFTDNISEEFRANLTLNPFAKVNGVEHPAKSGVPTVLESDTGVVENYSLVWIPRPHLELAIENHYTVTSLPNMSGLYMASSFSASPWSQTALSVTYNLNAFNGMTVKFVAGNGEGENGKNMDPQQYFGFNVDAALIDGVRMVIGASFDGNSVGSESYKWRIDQVNNGCGAGFTPGAKLGYSSQRLAVGAFLDGTMAAARGLKVGLGWQRNILSDLNKDAQSELGSQSLIDDCGILSADDLFVENVAGNTANTVQNRVLELSASYRILDTYFVGFDYESRTTDTGSVDMVEECDGYKGLACAAPGSTGNSIEQTAYTLGAGAQFDRHLELVFEYNVSKYEKQYSKFFYRGRDDSADDTEEKMNLRLAYNWE